ncbi:hypothetical protein MPTK1_7g09850 [Marchantia polymorpha subsp. ruderalis]|uniref:NADP-dependent oxidoreductase domain-containing protein n=2 Tax=Marchantia polymorpha TaxID=3197 RepID=A0AAF6BXX0_MARPO|nr:hypothetical protein MARPO_0003s0005 [Marchantia polymorpha]BBN16854.1 hypothetical protein Mp_7g09850 [Marchantia polymorpha subsp. ruderalis]|eukprot:PTQ49094.1 hypothetical protein MARPO_0003s0005 [Marchantia polymorpha]
MTNLFEDQSLKLNTGALMPAIALGMSAREETPEEVKAYFRKALEIGYRHFDTASAYKTEPMMGEVLEDVLNSGTIKREEFFITTKLSPEQTHADDVIPSLRESLSNLRIEYVDLYLIHFPIRIKPGMKPSGARATIPEDAFLPLDLVGVWKELEQCVELGLTRAIGVSNFGSNLLGVITADAKIIPAVNQVEMHPGCLQPRLLDVCKQMGIKVMGFAALGRPKHSQEFTSIAVIDSPILKEIAEKHGKSVAQVALRWSLDHGVGVVVKSSNPSRMAQNLNVFGWNLDEEDHKKIATMPRFRLQDGKIWINQTTSPYRSHQEIYDCWSD